jgi:hypothetical protein
MEFNRVRGKTVLKSNSLLRQKLIRCLYGLKKTLEQDDLLKIVSLAGYRWHNPDPCKRLLTLFTMCRRGLPGVGW